MQSFANVHVIHSRTIRIYDCDWDAAYIVMGDAMLNLLQKYMYAWPALAPSKYYLWLWLRQRLIAMDDAIWSRLQTYVLPTPEPSQSMIIADTVLKMS